MHPRFARHPIVLATVFLVYFLLGHLGLTLADLNASSTAVWPPSGFALAALLLVGLPVWPAVWAAPVETGRLLLGALASDSRAAADTARFFLGQAVESPDDRFYPVALAVRASPALALGVLLSPLVLRRSRAGTRLPR